MCSECQPGEVGTGIRGGANLSLALFLGLLGLIEKLP